MNLKFNAILLVCILPFVHPGPIDLKDGTPTYTLPLDVTPSRYALTLTVDVGKIQDKDSTYQGQEDIVLSTDKDGITEVKLHSDKRIKISLATLQATDDSTNTNLLDDGDIGKFDEVTSILTLTLKKDNKLEKKKPYTLHLEFEATYRDDMYGFYKSSYVDADKKTHWLVTTQFESVAARSAFPCFDEPHFKAVYDIKIKIEKSWVDNKYHVLSNSKIESKDKMDGDYVIFDFEDTPVALSSYLVAFIVSDFQSRKDPALFDTDKPFLTWGQEKFFTNNEDDLSQKVGPAVLDIYKDQFKIPFAYKKLDQVGIPDFNAGAMENWGLTTYRERMLFFDDKKNSAATKQSTVMVTAHELAHQWFGDLVTLHNWDDVWLNEGFADYFEYHGTHLIKVEGLNAESWNLLAQFVTDELQSDAFEIDGLESARPLTSHVEKPDEIEANFDSIAYSKGGSVIRMWQHVLGKDLFYAGLTNYLNKFKGGNARPEDLLQAFQDEIDNLEESKRPNLNGKSVSDAFKNWHLSAGYPVLTVQHIDKAKYNFTQERFLWKIDNKKVQVDEWEIPISYSTFENPNFENTVASQWLEADKEFKEIDFGNDKSEKPKWIIINNQEAGYYRVNYDEENWKSLMEELNSNHTNIHEINRAQIIDDAFSLARSTQKETAFLSYDIALGLTQYLAQEKDYVPWSAASNAFSFLNTKLTKDDTTYGYFKQHVLKAVKDRYDELKLTVNDKDTHLNRLLRILIASWACKLGNNNCIEDAESQLSNPDAISPDVKSIVYCTAVRKNDSLWDTVWDAYNTATNNLDQTLFLSALGCSKNKDNLIKLLDETIKGENSIIRKQDLQAAFSSVYNGNPENVEIALTFLKNNLDKIKEMYGGTDPVGKLLIGLSAKAVTDNDIKTLKEDILKPILAGNEDKIKKSAKLALDTLASTENWLQVKQQDIATWFKDQNNNGGGDGGDGGAAEITVSVLTVISCLALLFSS